MFCPSYCREEETNRRPSKRAREDEEVSLSLEHGADLNTAPDAAAEGDIEAMHMDPLR